MAEARTITPAIRVVDNGREWVIQTAETKRNRNGSKPTGEWIDRAYITSRSMLNAELKRLVGKGATRSGLVGHVEREVLDWLNSLPVQHPSRGAAPKLSVIDILEAMGTNHTAYDLRDDLPLIVQHGPLKYRDRWNARYDV